MNKRFTTMLHGSYFTLNQPANDKYTVYYSPCDNLLQVVASGNTLSSVARDMYSQLECTERVDNHFECDIDPEEDELGYGLAFEEWLSSIDPLDMIYWMFDGNYHTLVDWDEVYDMEGDE